MPSVAFLYRISPPSILPSTMASSSSSSSSSIVASSGKVLIAGGYLVLDPAYSGVVVSTSSSFYTAVSHNTSGAGFIYVRSPQFIGATWLYHIQLRGNDLLVFPADENTSNNKFVHLALQKTLALVSEIKGTSFLLEVFETGSLDISIVGDNDFYSQRAELEARQLPRKLDSLASLKPFLSTNATLSKVHKTGLGSSAALITSLVSALLLRFAVLTPDDFGAQVTDGKRLAHHLAQYVHCLAQGKIGSGFDVSAAVFGSQIYTRFDPTVIEGIMKDGASLPLLPVLSPANPKWDYHVKPFALPPLTRLLLADVDAGSDTPSLVGSVLKWRQEKPDEANALWARIDVLNQSFADALNRLSELYKANEKAYIAGVRYVNSVQPVQWFVNPMTIKEDGIVIEAFYQVHKISQSIRAAMREMGTLANVPIEPSPQTRLLNTCLSYAGVIAGGVPGAGGFDAQWLLVCDLPAKSILPDIPAWMRPEHVWQNWTEIAASPLLATESTANGMQVVERPQDVPGLLEALYGTGQA